MVPLIGDDVAPGLGWKDWLWSKVTTPAPPPAHPATTFTGWADAIATGFGRKMVGVWTSSAIAVWFGALK